MAMCDGKSRKEAWDESHGKPDFQASLTSLFSETTDVSSRVYLSLGSYILLHVLIQHIFFLRQTTSYQPVGERSLSKFYVLAMANAVESWREEWEGSPESSLDPKDPHGPIAFD